MLSIANFNAAVIFLFPHLFFTFIAFLKTSSRNINCFYLRHTWTTLVTLTLSNLAIDKRVYVVIKNNNPFTPLEEAHRNGFLCIANFKKPTFITYVAHINFFRRVRRPRI